MTVELHRQQQYLDHWLLRLRRHLDNRRYLWQLPWYMVIGPAGSGKSTLLREAFRLTLFTRRKASGVWNTTR